MSETPKLDRLQRAEAELLIERISSDVQALEDFVFAAIYYRAKHETELTQAQARCAELEKLLHADAEDFRALSWPRRASVIDAALKG